MTAFLSDNSLNCLKELVQPPFPESLGIQILFSADEQGILQSLSPKRIGHLGSIITILSFGEPGFVGFIRKQHKKNAT